MNKKVTVILTKTPYSSQLNKDAQNAILSLTAFFDDIKVIFSQKASYQLLNNQNAKLYGYKNIPQIIQSFQWYDIDKIYLVHPKIEVEMYYNNELDIEFISEKNAIEYIRNSLHCFIY